MESRNVRLAKPPPSQHHEAFMMAEVIELLGHMEGDSQSTCFVFLLDFRPRNMCRGGSSVRSRSVNPCVYIYRERITCLVTVVPGSVPRDWCIADGLSYCLRPTCSGAARW